MAARQPGAQPGDGDSGQGRVEAAVQWNAAPSQPEPPGRQAAHPQTGAPPNPALEMLAYFAQPDRSAEEDIRVLAALSFLSVLSTISLIQQSSQSPAPMGKAKADAALRQSLIDLLLSKARAHGSPGDTGNLEKLLASLATALGSSANPQDTMQLLHLIKGLGPKSKS